LRILLQHTIETIHKKLNCYIVSLPSEILCLPYEIRGAKIFLCCNGYLTMRSEKF